MLKLKNLMLLVLLSVGPLYAEVDSDFYTDSEKAELDKILSSDYISQKKEEALSQMAQSRLKKIKEITINEQKNLDKSKLDQIGWPDESLWLQYQADQVLYEKREKSND